MSKKTVKQTAVEYFSEPSLSKADIQAMQDQLFPSPKKSGLFSLLTIIPRPLLATFALIIVALPTILITQGIYRSNLISVDAKNFASNIYQQTQSNIVYLEIYSDNVDQTILSQAWYDSSLGLSKNQRSNHEIPEYSYLNVPVQDVAKAPNDSIFDLVSTESATTYDNPSIPELSAFMRALGQSINSSTQIEDTQYKGEPAYKVVINNSNGSGISSIYFIKNTNVVYINNGTYTRKVIYRFIKSDLYNQNSIFNTSQ